MHLSRADLCADNVRIKASHLSFYCAVMHGWLACGINTNAASGTSATFERFRLGSENVLPGSLNFDVLIKSQNFDNIQHHLLPKVPET